jgi:hypothetical protein
MDRCEVALTLLVSSLPSTAELSQLDGKLRSLVALLEQGWYTNRGGDIQNSHRTPHSLGAEGDEVNNSLLQTSQRPAISSESLIRQQLATGTCTGFYGNDEISEISTTANAVTGTMAMVLDDDVSGALKDGKRGRIVDVYTSTVPSSCLYNGSDNNPSAHRHRRGSQKTAAEEQVEMERQQKLLAARRLWSELQDHISLLESNTVEKVRTLPGEQYKEEAVELGVKEKEVEIEVAVADEVRTDDSLSASKDHRRTIDNITTANEVRSSEGDDVVLRLCAGDCATIDSLSSLLLQSQSQSQSQHEFRYHQATDIAVRSFFANDLMGALKNRRGATVTEVEGGDYFSASDEFVSECEEEND